MAVIPFAVAAALSLAQPGHGGGRHPAPSIQAPQEMPQMLTPRELAYRLAKGRPTIVADVRRANAFKRRHIKGAQSLPHVSLKAWGPKLTKKDLVVLYCG